MKNKIISEITVRDFISTKIETTSRFTKLFEKILNKKTNGQPPKAKQGYQAVAK